MHQPKHKSFFSFPFLCSGSLFIFGFGFTSHRCPSRPWRAAPNVPAVNNPCPFYFDNGTTLIFGRTSVMWAPSVDYAGTWNTKASVSVNGTMRPEDPGVWRDQRGKSPSPCQPRPPLPTTLTLRYIKRVHWNFVLELWLLYDVLVATSHKGLVLTVQGGAALGATRGGSLPQSEVNYEHP